MDSAELAAKLAGILPGSPRVEITGAASVGAQRSTLFIDRVRGETREPAVVQIASTVLASLDVETEVSLLRAAAKAGVPVPELLAWDTGLRAIVTSRVDGESIPRRILRLVEGRPELGARLASDCGRALAALHAVPAESFGALPDLSDPLRYVDELADGLDTIREPIPALRLGLNWLRRHPPAAPPRPALVHGDFRNGNVLVTETGLAAVLDWELAHRGDPMEDLAWLCLRTWRFGLDEHEVGGFARRSVLREAYEAAGGAWREEAFHWWTVARTAWWGLGLARQAQAFLDGQAPSIVLAASGRRVVELEYDLLTLIAPS
ncbi:MAG: phosphotransferase family protein [Myxococcota bacterium]|nr:phosphotransferase family protein [Myxococcota bacterium]